MNKIFFKIALIFLIALLSASLVFARSMSKQSGNKNEDVIIEIPSLEVEGEEELEDLLKSLEEAEENEETKENTSSIISSFSLETHQFLGGINCIERDFNSTKFFYVGGEDGFVSKISYPSLKMQTWQISQLPIKKIAPHPDSATVAFYESDGTSIHKISSWNWKLRERKFIIRPNYPVTYIAWSANGSYLLVGNTENGIEIFNNNGEIVDIYSKKPGIVLLATTGKREKSIVSYSRNGKITYTAVQGKKKLAECKSEDELEYPCIFQNFTRIAGYKDGKIIVVKASDGVKQEEYQTDGEVIFTTHADSDKLIWLSKHKKKNNYALNIANESTAYFALPSSKAITSSIYLDSSIIAGDEDGRLHILKKENGKVSYTHHFEYKNEMIEEIASNGNTLFMLKNGNLIEKKGVDANEEILKGRVDYTSILCDNENVILWSKDEKKPIQKYDIIKQKMTAIYKPKTSVISLSLYNKNIVVVEASGLISLINLDKGKILFSQNIEGAESALQRGEDYIVVAKNTFDNAASPLFEINIKTKESVPIKLPGELAYFLARSREIPNTFFCFLFDSTNGSKTTNLIQFATEENKTLTAKFENLLSYADEDFSPFIESYKGAIITNLGKDSLIYFNLYSKKITQLQRSFALPKKAVLVGESIVSLGLDGSLNWHSLASLNE